MLAFRSIRNSEGDDVNDPINKPVKFVIDLLATPHTFILNISMSLGVFHRLMQSAKVVLLFKVGDNNVLGKCRPISIL